MRASKFQRRFRGAQAGFTLLEMSTAIGIMVVLALALIVMLQQHVRFMELFRGQTFLSAEAPKIGNLLGRIFNKSDHFFVYESKDAALAEGTPVLGSGQAVRLFFKSATQETTAGVVAVESTEDGASIRYYGLQPDGTWNSWTISDRIASASLASELGILSMTLDGPNGEQVTYSGGAR